MSTKNFEVLGDARFLSLLFRSTCAPIRAELGGPVPHALVGTLAARLECMVVFVASELVWDGDVGRADAPMMSNDSCKSIVSE